MLNFLKNTPYIFTQDTNANELNTSEEKHAHSHCCPTGNGIINDKLYIENMAQKQKTAHTENQTNVKGPAQGKIGKGRDTIQGKMKHFM